MAFTDEQRERFELRTRDLMHWLCVNCHQNMVIIITPTSSELLESHIRINTNEHVQD